MKNTLIFCSLFAASALSADTTIASRGNASVTVEDVKLSLDRVPEDQRRQFLMKPDRLDRELQSLLLNRQMAAVARERKLLDDPIVKKQIELSTERLLANYLLRDELKRREAQDKPNFKLYAHEQYLVNKASFKTEAARGVSHILIKDTTRTEAEAKALAEKIAKELKAGAKFDAMVSKYSEDEMSKEAGMYTKGQLTPEFEVVADQLKKVGAIGGPVKSPFGYHIIRLDADLAARQKTFEEVAPELEAEARKNWEKSARTAFMRDYSLEELSFNGEGMKELLEHFGVLDALDAIDEHYKQRDAEKSAAQK
jgi:peptidyl-prolyl cis-trans isomerase C